MPRVLHTYPPALEGGTTGIDGCGGREATLLWYGAHAVADDTTPGADRQL